ncbi:MAG: hypothetical protein V8S95_02160 [Odoribacter sp.]
MENRPTELSEGTQAIARNRVYQKLWIERVGSIGLRRLADELLRLEKQVGLNWDKKRFGNYWSNILCRSMQILTLKNCI